MPGPRARDVLVSAARLYYLDGRSQGEVARALGVSRSSVSRILAAARDQGIVEIRIHDAGAPVLQVPELEQRLANLFDLSLARVGVPSTPRASVDVVADLSAQVFEEYAPGTQSMALSWGRTISRFVERVEVQPFDYDLNIYPLVGGMSTMDTGPSGNLSISTLARKCGATAHRLQAPAVVESSLTRAALMQESYISRVLAASARTDFAIVGIGSYGVHASQRVLRAMSLSHAELAQVERQHPVGDICGRFFDAEGHSLGPPTSERVIGLTLEELAGIPTVLGLAAGAEKAPGVLGALRSGVLNGIVLDEDLARAVLELVEEAGTELTG